MRIMQRIYEDYFKPSRLPDYKRILEAFRDAGYQMISILDLYNMVISGGITGKVFINRHDIDTSPNVAREMFEIEKEIYGHEGSATYYFRDSTIDKRLIREIEDYGYETGYHYEELATFEKINKLKNVEKMRESLPKCRQMFIDDIMRFREITESSSLTVASHGDFINTKYRIQNVEILRDIETREKAKIVVEAYDANVMECIEARYADQVLLSNFAEEVLKGIKEGNQVIMTLTHPRNWKVDVIANTKDNVRRYWQGIKYRH